MAEGMTPLTEPKKKGRGCFFYGCITLIVLIIVLVVGSYFAAKHFINSTVETYTDTKPMVLPVIQPQPDQQQAIENRIATFVQGVDSGAAVPPLELTGDEINILIAGRPELNEIQGKVFVEIENDLIRGKVGVPLAELGFPGRYLNGVAGFRINLTGGILSIYIDSLQVNGQDVPEAVMSQLRVKNVAEDMMKDPELREHFKKFSSIIVQNGKLVVTAAPPTANSTTQPVLVPPAQVPVKAPSAPVATH